MDTISKKFIIADFLKWWYGAGKRGALGWWLHFWKIVIFYVIDTFSLRILLPALITFQPWKKDKSAIGRGVAFVIRFFFAIFGFSALFATVAIATAVIVFWVLLIPVGILRIAMILKDYTL